MSDNIAVLATHLFDDEQTVRAAMDQLSDTVDTHIIDLIPDDMNDKDWDQVLGLILSASKVVTI